MSDPITYKDSGVNIDAANVATSRIRKLAKTTFNENVMSEIGSFGGMVNGTFAEIREPVLVSSCDGVGTKLKIAVAMGVHGMEPRMWRRPPSSRSHGKGSGLSASNVICAAGTFCLIMAT